MLCASVLRSRGVLQPRTPQRCYSRRMILSEPSPSASHCNGAATERAATEALKSIDGSMDDCVDHGQDGSCSSARSPSPGFFVERLKTMVEELAIR